MTARSRHILVLTDRDWTHPEAGTARSVLRAKLESWARLGHRVTVIAATYPGAEPLSRPAPGLEVHRMGGPRTVHLRAARATLRGLARDADVVLEACEGGSFLTSLWLWLRIPRVLWVAETADRDDAAPAPALPGRFGRLLEPLALRRLSPGVPIVAGSRDIFEQLERLGVDTDRVHVVAGDDAAAGDAAAAETLAVVEQAMDTERLGLRRSLLRTESGRAAGLAAATLINNLIQLIFTVVFTRVLGKSGYGDLAALISAFLILLVAGQALQLAAAREAALDRLGNPAALRATLRAWTQRLLMALVVVAVASALLRDQIGLLVGVEDEPWAAAALPVTGVLWMLLSLQRGALQGLRAYRAVGLSMIGEAAGRLVCSLVLVAAGFGVTGALLGLPLAFVLMTLWLERELHRRVGPIGVLQGSVRTLRSLIGDGWVAIIGLFLLASLQNIDVILAKHQLDSDAAGSYAAAAVAAKAVVWVAIGIGLQLLPEATRRAAAGLDPRPVLLRALAILLVIAAPALLIFALFPELLLRLAFGPGFTQASGALILLGIAMTLLAVAYLTVQYMVALGEVRFVWLLAVVAIAEPFLLTAGDEGIEAFAAIVLAVQCAAAGGVLMLGLRARRRWVALDGLAG